MPPTIFRSDRMYTQRTFHGPSAEPGLTAEEYRETMDEYYAELDDQMDYADTIAEEEDTDGDDD